MDCRHIHTAPTGELRPLGGCRQSSNPRVRPIYRCGDCGAYLAEGTPVSAPVPFHHLLMQVHQGLLSREAALAQFGNLSESERTEIGEAVVCDHHRKRTRVTIYDCPDCGRQIQEVTDG